MILCYGRLMHNVRIFLSPLLLALFRYLLLSRLAEAPCTFGVTAACFDEVSYPTRNSVFSLSANQMTLSSSLTYFTPIKNLAVGTSSNFTKTVISLIKSLTLGRCFGGVCFKLENVSWKHLYDKANKAQLSPLHIFWKKLRDKDHDLSFVLCVSLGRSSLSQSPKPQSHILHIIN